MLTFKKLGKQYANVEAGDKLESLTAIEVELFLCVIEKISMVSNSQRGDQGMPVIMEIFANTWKDEYASKYLSRIIEEV